jgi:folate-binding protein YgfZ
MARVSPLRKLQQEAEASLAPYGPPEADVLVVETFGELDLEYAALRKGCILVDQPQRGMLELTRGDRLAFLNRMVTQELKGFEHWQVRRSFWLNRKGRIDADLRLIELGDWTLVDLDVHAAKRAADGLGAFIVADDVTIVEATEDWHRMALHGPTALDLLRVVSQPVSGPGLQDLTPGHACRVSIGGREVLVDRDDSTGEVGLELLVKAADAVAVYQQLIEAGQPHDQNGQSGSGSDTASRVRLRPAGWHAFNIARIEAGRPLYNLDFGPDSLPHETGVLRDRVSFTKGCYLGQEVVARMESRGHSKRTLVALKCAVVPGADGEPIQPITGGLIYAAESADAEPVGAITSSTISPMLGATPICFAMVRPGSAEAGTTLFLAADDTRIAATVQAGLVFWKR